MKNQRRHERRTGVSVVFDPRNPMYALLVLLFLVIIIGVIVWFAADPPIIVVP